MRVKKMPRAALAALVFAAPAWAQSAPAEACPPGCAAACCVDLASLVAFTEPDLWVGDKAPRLEVASFLKGESVHAFEEGRVYVVEFWATWCGPCIRAMPHVTGLQEEYAGKATVVGVNIWDTKPGESQAARLERVGRWVEQHADRMGYTVAISRVEGEAEPVSQAWMKAADRPGIPSAFIVDAAGRIAWMGSPTLLDEPLARVVAGTHDYAHAAEEVKDAGVMAAAFRAYAKGIHAADPAQADRAHTLGRALVRQQGTGDAELLNAIAWTAVDHEAPAPRAVAFGLETAEAAVEASGGADPMILDTLAVAAFKSGDRERAIEVETRALSLLKADDPNREAYVKQLEEFRNAG